MTSLTLKNRMSFKGTTNLSQFSNKGLPGHMPQAQTNLSEDGSKGSTASGGLNTPSDKTTRKSCISSRQLCFSKIKAAPKAPTQQQIEASSDIETQPHRHKSTTNCRERLSRANFVAKNRLRLKSPMPFATPTHKDSSAPCNFLPLLSHKGNQQDNTVPSSSDAPLARKQTRSVMRTNTRTDAPPDTFQREILLQLYKKIIAAAPTPEPVQYRMKEKFLHITTPLPLVFLIGFAIS